MPEAYFADPDVTLYCADAIDALRELPDQSVHMACTSPPFFGLRDYGTGAWEGGDKGCAHALRQNPSIGTSTLEGGKATVSLQASGFRDECGRCGARRIDSQIGLESSPDEWAARLVDVFRELRRVLRDDAVCFIEIGDSYASNGPGGMDGSTLSKGGTQPASSRGVPKRRAGGLKPKDLIGQPWLLAFALRADGWYLRSCIVWHKPNAMPESVTDRPTSAHSYVFLLSKKPRYFYDAEALREPAEWARWGDQTVPKHEGTETASGWIPGKTKQDLLGDQRRQLRGGDTASGFNGRWESAVADGTAPTGKNARSVWTIPTESNALAICRVCDAYWQGGAPREHCGEPVVQHFAAFPRDLVRRMILAGTSERGVCADCGAPWVRETESEYVKSPVHGAGSTVRGRNEGIDVSGWAGEALPRVNKSVTTLGWLPSCSCGHEFEDRMVGESPHPIPATILDPFAGSGTSLLVARQLGRHAIGIELSERYAAMCKARLSQQSLFTEAVGA